MTLTIIQIGINFNQEVSYMSVRLVLPVRRQTTVVVMARFLHDFLASHEDDLIREFLGLNRDVPYVADVITTSLMPVGVRDFWKFHSLNEAKKCLIEDLNGPKDGWEARWYADQLLLLFGFDHISKMRLGGISQKDINILKSVGSEYYRLASEIEMPNREDVLAMSEDFAPWTEVLPCFLQNHPIIKF